MGPKLYTNWKLKEASTSGVWGNSSVIQQWNSREWGSSKCTELCWLWCWVTEAWSLGNRPEKNKICLEVQNLKIYQKRTRSKIPRKMSKDNVTIDIKIYLGHWFPFLTFLTSSSVRPYSTRSLFLLTSDLESFYSDTASINFSTSIFIHLSLVHRPSIHPTNVYWDAAIYQAQYQVFSFLPGAMYNLYVERDM